MTNPPKRILIAVKPWDKRLPLATAFTQQLAEQFGAQIALLSCVTDSLVTAGFALADPTDLLPIRPDVADAAKAELERLALPLRDAGIFVTTRVVTRIPEYRAILAEAADWQADLVVAGIHESEPSPDRDLTDIEHHLMRLCPCPLLLVRRAGVGAYRSIVAAVDPLHEHAEPAGLDGAVLEIAATLSRAFEAELCAVNASPDPEDFEMVSAVQVEPGVFYGSENIEDAHRQALADLLDEVGMAGLETVLRSGEPARVLLDVAREREIDLMVLGSIKRGLIEEAIVGTTAERVVKEGACDVLLVKSGD